MNGEYYFYAYNKAILFILWNWFYPCKCCRKSLLDDFVIVKNKGEGEKNEDKKN